MKPHLAPAAREPGSAVGRLFRRRNARFAVPLAVATLAVAAQAYAAGSTVKGRVTGVERLVVVTPSPGGKTNPLVLAAAHLAGVDEVWRIGGAQAVAMVKA